MERSTRRLSADIDRGRRATGRPDRGSVRPSAARRGDGGATVADRMRVGVVGCGLIAQVMHLPYLAELSDRFEIVALCDTRTDLAAACAERYGQPHVHAHWEDLLAEPLDAIVIATSGDHAPIAIAAAQAGLHVLVE